MKGIEFDLLDTELSSVDLTARGSISIKSIDMQNFNKYGKGPNKIDFDEDLYVIKGPTGAGKSSILDAITFALFKRKNTINRTRKKREATILSTKTNLLPHKKKRI